MSSIEEQIAQLEAAMGVQEMLRPALGDQAVDAVVARLKAQVKFLREPARAHTLGGQLDQLAAAELVSLVDSEQELTYIFKHALTQEAAYSSLLRTELIAIHKRVAQCYEMLYAESLDDFAPVLAHHYGEAGDDAKAVEHSIKAAESAARIFAYPEASLHYSRALDAFKRLPDTPELRSRRVDTIARYVELAWGASVPEQQLVMLAEAERLTLSMPGADGAPGDPLRLARIRTMMAAMHLARNEYRDVVRLARPVLELAHMLGDNRLVITPAAQLGAVMVLQGHFSAAVPYLGQALELLEENTDRWEWAWCVGFVAISLAMRGEVSAGLAEARRGLARMEATNNHVGTATSLAYLLAVCLELGDMTRLLEESRRAIQVASTSGAALYVSVGLDFQALALSRLGRHQEAHGRMTESRAMAARIGGQYMMSDWLSAAHAEIAYNAGEFQDALTRAEQAVALAQSFEGDFAQGWAQRVWGQALHALDPSRWAEAEVHLGESLRLLQACDARLEAAQTHDAWGRLRRALADEDGAQAHFAEAAAQFEASGVVTGRGIHMPKTSYEPQPPHGCTGS